MGYFRELRAEEIDCRIQSINEKGLVLLLYKDARVDQNVLDETFGIFGWQRSHQSIDGRLYCTVSVYDKEKGQWISKQDVGTESYTEKEKGEASDSFKRACFNLGIGRELYTAPFVWIDKTKYTAVNVKGKPATYDKFRVSEIKVKDGVITALKIVNINKNAAVFTYGKVKADSTKKEAGNSTKENAGSEERNGNDRISPEQAEILRAMCIRHKMPERIVFERYKKITLEDMTVNDWAVFAAEGKEILDEWDKKFGEDNRATA